MLVEERSRSVSFTLRALRLQISLCSIFRSARLDIFSLSRTYRNYIRKMGSPATRRSGR